MNVVLDANILIKDYLLRNQWFRDLGHYLKSISGSLIVPRVALDEAIANYGRDYAAEWSLARRRFEGLRKFSEKDLADTKVLDAKVEAEIENYREFLEKTLKRWNAVIAKDEIPSLETLLASKISRAKPFKESGHGTCDYVIWQCVKRTVLERGTTAFVSGNSSDFADQEKKAIHSDLLAELGNRATELKYYADIQQLLEDQFARPTWATVQHLMQMPNFVQVASLIKRSAEAMPDHGLYYSGAKLSPLTPQIKSFYLYQGKGEAYTAVIRFRIPVTVSGSIIRQAGSLGSMMGWRRRIGGEAVALVSAHCELTEKDIRLQSILSREIVNERIVETTPMYRVLKGTEVSGVPPWSAAGLITDRPPDIYLNQDREASAGELVLGFEPEVLTPSATAAIWVKRPSEPESSENDDDATTLGDGDSAGMPTESGD